MGAREVPVSMYPAEHRALRELHATGRQLAGQPGLADPGVPDTGRVAPTGTGDLLRRARLPPSVRTDPALEDPSDLRLSRLECRA